MPTCVVLYAVELVSCTDQEEYGAEENIWI